TGGYSEDMIPTVGFNMRKLTKGNVTIKLWDLGGQPRFRSMWERYCRAVSAIVYGLSSMDSRHGSMQFCDFNPIAELNQIGISFPRFPVGHASLIQYVVDAADRDNLPTSRSELHDLLSKPSLSGIPLLVLGNKIDKPEALSKQGFTDEM
ncbi:hypothetical protein BHE74_00027903, partial [Ensete ventricosum]